MRDGLAHYNTHTITLKINISALQKDGKTADQAENILNGDFVIGVWASASRPKTKTLNSDGPGAVESGEWVQVSRLGMPLTNEVLVPIGDKDYWNALTTYQDLGCKDSDSGTRLCATAARHRPRKI